jgi:hypothetical protein
MAFSVHTIYRAVSPLFRKRRMGLFHSAFRPTPATTVLDVGGYPGNWTSVVIRPQVTVLNVHPIDYGSNPADPPIRTVVGDGCQLDFADQAFDIVFSNSVIEHLGTFEKQMSFANECRRVGKRVWVQSPARSFFIEPHFLTPLIHFLPRRAQRKLVRNFTVWGLITRPTAQQVRDFLAEIRLLNHREMQELFPDCVIIPEKFIGFTKSYIAIR